MNTRIMSLGLLLAISTFILQADGQFSAISVAGDLFGLITGHALRNKNARLIEHPASGKCMNIERALIGSGIKIIMYDCNWRDWLTPVNELFYFGELNGAYLIKGAASHSNMCLYTGNNYNDPLYTIGCKKDDNRQQFEFRKLSHDEYQIVQRSTGRCLRADGHGNGSGIRSVNCDGNDRDQKWRVCTGKRDCNKN